LAQVQPVRCGGCGRSIGPKERIASHGGRTLCPQCDLKTRLGCPDLLFCTRCQALISRRQKPAIIDHLVVCESCAPPPPSAEAENAAPLPEQGPPPDVAGEYEAAQALSSRWLSRNERNGHDLPITAPAAEKQTGSQQFGDDGISDEQTAMRQA
jgi:hypothetical protein